MMEKNTVPTSLATTKQKTEEAVRKVPLPNQLPKGIDFSDLPVNQLRSATLESLINQNEDLMARLSVSLRRTNEFENQLQRLEGDNKTLRTRFETLKDQYLLTTEKDRISSSRLMDVHQENVENRAKFEKLEKIYSELFVQAQAFQQRVVKLERNRVRLLEAARSLQQQAKQGQKAAEQVDQLRQELDHGAVTQQQSTQSYEVKIADVRTQIESMRGKIAERDSLYADKVRVENQLIYEQRQNESQREEREGLIDRLSTENTSLRTQLKETLVDNEAARQEAARLSTELPHLKIEKQNLTEQVESLQALWTHKQRELELSEEKNRALQKLNQSISLTLNQQRKAIHGLEQDLEKERFAAGEKIKTLLAELQLLRSEK